MTLSIVTLISVGILPCGVMPAWTRGFPVKRPVFPVDVGEATVRRLRSETARAVALDLATAVDAAS